MPTYNEDYLSPNDIDQDEDLSIDNIDLIDSTNFHQTSQNKIILGTKPQEKDPYSVQVVLTDWRYILTKNRLYCQDCMILFPTQNTIDAHRMLIHSLLVAVEDYQETPWPNKAKKSTTKSVVKVKSEFEVKVRNKAVKSTAKVNNVVVKSEPCDVKVGLHQCPICTCVYITEKHIGEHFIRNHRSDSLVSVMTPFTGECSFCDFRRKFSSLKSYNLHIRYEHYKEFMKSCENYVCNDHDLSFTSANALHIHQVAAHLKTDATSNSMYAMVPKDILFKCNNCSCHFLSSCVAFYHSVRCLNSTSEWNCTQCNLGFRLADKKIHKLQHIFGDTFNVIPVSHSLTKSVLCKCPKCAILFEEREFWGRHSFKCTETAAVTCVTCGLKIEESLLFKHRKLHAEQLDTLVVEFFAGNLEIKTVKKSGLFPGLITLYYCSACQMYCHSRTKYHLMKNCLQMKRRTCKLCGLCFSMKGFTSHLTSEHSDKNFKLEKVTFVDIFSQEKIFPMLPTWKKCAECNVNFFSRRALMKHNCYEEKFKTCGKCKEDFSDMAYKLHLPFHQYDAKGNNEVEISEILKTYESMQSLWNIIYLCETCDVVFDDYDKTVEHSQNHFCNAENVRTETCFVCKLKFDEGSYKNHANIHMNKIKKSSFQILKFNYEKLLNDAWYDIFERISKEQRGHILAKSVYNVERSIRLKLEVEGFSYNTLFKCSICKLIIDRHEILEHAKNQDGCENSMQKYECKRCNLVFHNEKTKLSHEYSHINIKTKDKTPRIITFNEREDFEKNNVLCNLSKKGSLKFNWCQQCNLLIKKEDYNKHVLKHRGKKVGYTIKKGLSKPKVTDYYKCMNCDAGVWNKINVSKHKCLSPRALETCKLCHMKFRKSHINNHFAFHKMIKPNPLNIIPFNNTNQGEARMLSVANDKILLTLYQCKKCTACIHNIAKKNKHVCASSPELLLSCILCGVQFRTLKYHKVIHKKIPNLTRANIKIVKLSLDDKADKRKIEPPKIVTPVKKMKLEPGSEVPVYRGIPALYKCSCHLLFTDRVNLVKHMRNCKQDRQSVECPDCGLQFHEKDIESHNFCIDHKFYLVARVVVDNERISDPNYWVSVCAQCNLYYINAIGVRLHMAKGHASKSYRNCNTCGVNFPLKSIKRHFGKHHSSMKVTVPNLNKEFFDLMSVSDLKELNSKVGEYFDVQLPLATQIQYLDDKPPLEAQNNSQTDDKKKPLLYKCTDCNLHFSSIKTLRYHYDFKLHHKKHFPCKYCGLHFTQILIRRHEKTEHTIEDFKVVVTAQNGLADQSLDQSYESSSNYSFEEKVREETPIKRKRFKIEETVNDLKNVSVKGKTADELSVIRKVAQTPVEDLKIIHQCGICKQSYLHVDSIGKHFRDNVHNCKQFGCEQCSLFFTSKSLARHVFMHHTLLKLSVKDLIIRVYSSKTSFHIEGLESNSESNAKCTSSTESHMNVPPVGPKLKSDAPKLFKCSPCDVYYTSFDMCFEHTTNHMPLDSTEYIACKICDLQLLCECLGVHMRGHRESTFNINDLVVTEFCPRSIGPPETSTFLAAEKLKLISTTTDCDEEWMDVNVEV